MIYTRPVYRPLGDLYVSVEFGDELSLLLNFRVLALDMAVKSQRLAGVTETVPTNRSLGVVYAPDTVSYTQLVRDLEALNQELTQIDELPSRLVTIPIWYNDPWSQECAKESGVPNNLEFVAELNSMTVDEVVQAHSQTLWWVSAVGFQPACYQAMPLDARFRVTAPKYLTPRRNTPERIVCQAGRLTSFYPVSSPGGYQLLGRTPLELYDPEQKNPAFASGPVLPRVSDRHQYVPIDESTYWRLRSQVEDGTYVYNIKEETFVMSEYLKTVSES